MFNDTLTKIIFLLMCIVFGLAMMLMVTETIDSKIESECKSCDSEYSWCEGYWKDKGRCGR